MPYKEMKKESINTNAFLNVELHYFPFSRYNSGAQLFGPSLPNDSKN